MDSVSSKLTEHLKDKCACSLKPNYVVSLIIRRLGHHDEKSDFSGPLREVPSVQGFTSSDPGPCFSGASSSSENESPSTDLDACESLLQSITLLHVIFKRFFEQCVTKYVCQNLFTIVQLLQQKKLALASILLDILESTDSPYVSSLCHKVVASLVCQVPCNDPDECHDYCVEFAQNLLKEALDGFPDNHGAKLVHCLYYVFHQEITPKRNVPDSCRSPAAVNGDILQHQKVVSYSLLYELRVQTQAITRNNPVERLQDNEDVYVFMTIWRFAISVYSQKRTPGSVQFVNALVAVLPWIRAITNNVFQKKYFDLYNEAFCYGSTLGLQSDVNNEMSALNHALIRAVSATDFFVSMKVTTTPHGIAGTRSDDGDPNQPSMQNVRAFLLILIKSLAMLVREANCHSSSEDSDSSASSRESATSNSSDMKIIESRISGILNKIDVWTHSVINVHQELTFLQTFFRAFADQDDALIEGLLCLVDIYSGLQPDVDDLQYLQPVDAFALFVNNICKDHSVIIDFLISNETCFLLYFLRVLKYLTRHPATLSNHPSKESVVPVLKSTYQSLTKLTKQALFPYNINPIIKLLQKCDRLFE